MYRWVADWDDKPEFKKKTTKLSESKIRYDKNCYAAPTPLPNLQNNKKKKDKISGKIVSIDLCPAMTWIRLFISIFR